MSLACLEQLVHIRTPANLPLLIYTEIFIPDQRVKAWAHIESRTRAILESLVLSREIGDDWLTHKPGLLTRKRNEDTILQVPSAVVPQEWNYIVNPASPDLDEIVWSEPAPFNFDRRLLWPALR